MNNSAPSIPLRNAVQTEFFRGSKGQSFQKSPLALGEPAGRPAGGRVKLLLLSIIISLLSITAIAEIRPDRAIEVKILYDFSGSMYPGYPETPRQVSGVDYFHEYADFRAWLADFVRQQERFNARTVSIHTFRSFNQFDPADIREIQPPVTAAEAGTNLESLFAHLKRSRGVDYTYLRESLAYITRNDFEGLIWIITDNRVESAVGADGGGDGAGGQTTRDFFISLKENDKYRSVHIYTYPFDDPAKEQHADLAVYGILVSPDELNRETAADYDNRFRTLRNYFPGKRHLKLKDLRVEPISMNISSSLGMDLESGGKPVKTEGHLKGIPFDVSIESKLTQHTITGGKLNIELQGELVPKDAKTAKKYGIKPIPATYFQPARLTLTGEIPPNSSVNLGRFYMYSRKSVSIPVTGFGNQIQAALSPFKVEFTGRGVLSSDQLQLEIKREGIESIRGIYAGADIRAIFLPEDEKITIQANPIDFNVGFTLKSGASRGMFLLVVFLIIIVPLALFLIYMSRKESYRLRIKEKDTPVMLRRLGSYDIRVDNQFIGKVKRGLGRGLSFTVNDYTRDLVVTPTKNEGEFQVTLPDSTAFFIFIDSLTRGPSPVKAQEPQTSPPSGSGPAPGRPRVGIRPPKR